ncbi:ribosomal-protein-alanine acetyltransferase [Actinosynnema mirum DSM 43827]|uniref:[Ribosomal protein bS18]-alanine N-acetyltransferase n=1 Tax=Actinosynnema mirum (strain ATCC 29888 / DSM 43827 / JCM 3225 / NBRC 14064 / NCIMB 13271 / NRRL B-12336 / IMRU 3971 / 101) TaxID=446462 RepID=C6WLW2_ACTMD|nr:ribosomal-protein-alanine acetyltransferase [Actinosynnema mirum DSM 43827]AXX33857.1 Ribosomal-protein-S18p-alanine acetyltransferase [Actinosynnema pretiosum subsp. pretiosum]
MNTGTVVLSPLRHEDVPRCVEIEHRLFPGDDPWSENSFLSELDAGNLYLGAYADGELVGYAGLGLTDFESSVHTIAVETAWQGRGIGKALLRALLERADRDGLPVFLEVRTDNEGAIGLYLAHGFERLGLRRRYYQPSGADAYTMGRPANRD